MKTSKFFTAILAMLMIASAQNIKASWYFGEEDDTDTTKYNVYYGTVISNDDKNPLPFATIEVQGLNLATVSNIDGEFTLKIPKESPVSEIKVSYVGYNNSIESISRFKNSTGEMIKLIPRSVNLDEITIRPEDALGLIDDLLSNIPDNYSTEDMMMTAFYRETIKKRRNYVSIAEAVVDIYKAAYDNDFRYDQVKLIQGRKSADVEKMDTLLFRVQGGPVTTLLLDIVKNPYLLLSEEYAKVYSFHISDVVSMNDRLHYVITFKQRPYVSTPFYNGKLFVDMDKLAITEAEFALNMENSIEVANMFIRKKPVGMSVIPEKAVYRAQYTIQDNNWYFSYARAEVKFKVDWDKKLLNTSYTTMSEIAITDRFEEGIVRFGNRERFKRSQVLDDVVYVFFDQDFWGGYNVIEPDQSIEAAIKRLNKKYLKTASDEGKP